MSVCDVMIKLQAAAAGDFDCSDDGLPNEDTEISELETLAQDAKVIMLSPYKFMREQADRCIYQVK